MNGINNLENRLWESADLLRSELMRSLKKG